MTMFSKFNGKCKRCGGFMAQGTKINWDRAAGAVHFDVAECDRIKAEPKVERPVVTADAKPIVDFLLAAKARGLQFPAVRFLGPDGQSVLRLYVAGPTSKAPGSIQVLVTEPDAAEDWYGRIEPSGTVVGRRLESNAALLAELAAIAADPAAKAKAYGIFSGRCSFCHASLTDDRSGSSLEVGYGPTCAKRYGLPHHPKGASKPQTLKPLAGQPIGVGTTLDSVY